ncbi:hypothetical protein GQX74_006821 [Glossina fuscipes]|nr:hypothetical protein GQX74_006821 [Glossina fuscipes]
MSSYNGRGGGRMVLRLRILLGWLVVWLAGWLVGWLPFRSYHHCYPVPSSSPLLFSPIPALPPSFLFPFEWYICVVMPRKKRKEKKSTPFSRVRHDFIDYIEFPVHTFHKQPHPPTISTSKRKIELKELEKGNKMMKWFVWHKLCKKSGVIAFRSKG